MIPRISIPAALVATLMLSGPTPVTAAQAADCGAATRTIEVRGATFHYLECGDGQPLVFVHGGLGSLHTFEAQLRDFAAEYRVIAYSRRFHPPNDAPGPGDEYTLNVHRDDLADLIGTVASGPVHLVGHSYGAYVALALALRHPELVRSVVLGEPPVLPLLSRTAVGEAVLEAWNRRVLDPSRDGFRRGDSEEGMRRFLDGICGPGCFDQAPPPQRADLMKYAPEFSSEMLTDRSDYLPPLACDAVGRLERPVLLVTGERSNPVFFLVTAELERCLNGEAHVMVPEADHNVMGNVRFYNRSVLAFLREHQGG